jgi:hypothetical protein
VTRPGVEFEGSGPGTVAGESFRALDTGAPNEVFLATGSRAWIGDVTAIGAAGLALLGLLWRPVRRRLRARRATASPTGIR